MNTIDKIMALADEYAGAAYQSSSYFKIKEGVEREVLRAAIIEALDMGEPVAWLPRAILEANDRNNWLTCETQKDAQWFPVYAAKDAK